MTDATVDLDGHHAIERGEPGDRRRARVALDRTARIGAAHRQHVRVAGHRTQQVDAGHVRTPRERREEGRIGRVRDIGAKAHDEPGDRFDIGRCRGNAGEAGQRDERDQDPRFHETRIGRQGSAAQKATGMMDRR